MNGQRQRLAAVIGLVSWLGFSADANAHFAMAPKLEVGPDTVAEPGATLLEFRGHAASRADFLRYLKRITAFDTKYDRQQPNFWFHLELIRGIALFHPENVHGVVDRLSRVSASDEKAFLVQWFGHQTEMFAGVLHFGGLAEDGARGVVMDMYGAGAKTAFLEELIVLGAMEPSLTGLRAFTSPMSAEQRRTIETGASADSEVTPPEEQRRMRQRWSAFRRDVMANISVAPDCQVAVDLDAAADAVILGIGNRHITLGDLLTLFGRPTDDRQWRAVREVNCRRAALFFAMGDLADELGLVPARVDENIRATRQLYRAAKGVAERLGGQLAEGENGIAVVRRMGTYPQILEVKDRYFGELKRALAGERAKLDEAFILSTPWSLKRKLAPQHSIHF
ncbi:MAG: hypothetical protein ACFB6S_07090 [Geminicoccaceae bacterium]